MEVDLGGSDHFSREVTCNVVRSKFRYGFSHVERVKCTLNRASARIYNIERSVLGVHAPFPHDHIKIELRSGMTTSLMKVLRACVGTWPRWPCDVTESLSHSSNACHCQPSIARRFPNARTNELDRTLLSWRWLYVYFG